jgi:FKBP-type peptidyl-prolyl cis-trans isomerase
MSPRTIQVGIAVAAALAVITVFFIFNPFATVQQNPSEQADSTGSSQLVVQDVSVGTGDVAVNGDTVSVNYTGKLANGTVFDTSVGKTPIQFVLGSGRVIAGWDQGLLGMKVGGKRILIIPPTLAYGPNDYGPIPGNSTLTFEVELVNVAHPTAPAAQ